MRKIRILGIAPFSGIKILMDTISQKRDDIEADVYIGNMDTGLSIARKYCKDGYDIIISRGGTAELIEKANLLPVVNIQTSVYDIFRTIRLANTSQKKYALIGFPSITQNAVFLKEMLQTDLPIHTVHNAEEAKTKLFEVIQSGYDFAICDVITNALASQYNLPSILINSGEESIIAAYDIAVQIVTQRMDLSEQNSLYGKVIDNSPLSVIIYSADKQVYYHSLITPVPDNINNILVNKIDSVMETGLQKFYFEYSGLLYSIQAKKILLSGKTLISYYINTRKVPLNLNKNGIRYTNWDQAQNDLHNSFCSIAGINNINQDILDRYLSSSLPIAVIGSPGTGKTAVVNYIYTHSPRSNAPMSIIDCSKINEKMWDFLTKNNSSPIGDTNTTIYFKNMRSLKEKQFIELVDIIDDLKLHNRNLIIFSFNSLYDNTLEELDQYAINKLHCLTITTSSLSENLEDLPDIISLYLNHLNILYGKNIIGIEPEGVHALQHFHWSYNYDQLMRVLNELALSSSTSTILARNVKQLLHKEAIAAGKYSAPAGFSTENKTLEEINLEIVRQAIVKAGGNQSKAAATLGISRTTLWRMLQKEPPAES